MINGATAPLLVRSFPIELTNGNDGRGSKWFRSSEIRKRIESQLRALGEDREPFEFPVRLKLTRVLGHNQRLWDNDSILRGSAKELIDALVAVGWFHDDGPKFITEVRGAQEVPAERREPWTRATVWKDDEI